MAVILLLILASLGMALFFLGGFIWAVRSGQFDDTCTPSLRVLTDEAAMRPRLPTPAANSKISGVFLGSARASRADCGASPQSCTSSLEHFDGCPEAPPVGEAPTGTREGACAPHDL